MKISSTLIVLGFALASMISVAQETSAQDASSKSSAGRPKVKKEELASHGFVLDDRHLPMCKISGTEGTCKVQAFVMGEKRVDEAGYACSKLDKATYVGGCDHGKLNGFSLVIADGSTKLTKEAFVAYFQDGKIAYPALTSFLRADTDANLGVQEQNKSYGCVYFGKWDKSAERCGTFLKIFGPDFFTESNAQSLRNGTFDLDGFRSKFIKYIQSN